MSGEHYFSATPQASARAVEIDFEVAGGTTTCRGGRGTSRPAGSIRARGAAAQGRVAGPPGPRATCWISAAGTARSRRAGDVCAGGDGGRNRRQRAGGGATRANAAGSGAATGACERPDDVAGGSAVRRDLVQPADPGRQGGAARAAGALAAAARAGRDGVAGGGAKHLGGDSLAGVAARARLRGRAAREPAGLPGAAGRVAGKTIRATAAAPEPENS